MSRLDDWEVLVALNHAERNWDGLITTDSSMLNQVPELDALHKTRLTLIVAVAAGHDPVKATGLLFAHLGRICEMTRRDRAQIWQLRPGTSSPSDPWEVLERVADRKNEPLSELYELEHLSQEQLDQDPLEAK